MFAVATMPANPPKFICREPGHRRTSGSGYIAGTLLYVDMISISSRIDTVRVRVLLITALIFQMNSILAVLFLPVTYGYSKPAYYSVHRVWRAQWIPS